MDASKVPRNFEGRFRVRVMEKYLEKFIDEINIYSEVRRDTVLT
jgi:hypothetical protein